MRTKRGLIGEIKKIWYDSLTNPDNGKYGRKSLTWFGGMILLTIVILDGVIEDVWPPDHVLFMLAGLIFGIGALSVVDKKNKMDHKENLDEDEEIQPPPNDPRFGGGR